MTVRVLLFASYADALGAAEISIELPPAATVRDVRSRLDALVRGKRVPSNPMIAVNQRYAGDEASVSSSDEVAIIPPVAGG